MNKKFISSAYHLLVFVLIEILFVFIVLHEFPKFHLYEKIGIIHLIYWVILIPAGYAREKAKKVWQKFLATYIPVVYHIAGHIYIGFAIIKTAGENDYERQHSLAWLIVATLALGVLIFLGEWLLHKKIHCDTHHWKVHKHCKND